MRARPRPWLDRIDPYVPGEPAADEIGCLASNESPIGASPAVAQAVVEALARSHRYPDPLARALRAAIAEHHAVAPEQILVGNGSDELIHLLTTAYAAHGGRVVCADPAYRLDVIAAHTTGAEVVAVPLRDWTHDLTAMAEVSASIAYVVNPHNPTGTAVSFDDVERFVEQARADLPVIDEAYVDFADDPDRTTAMPLAAAGRAVVLRTFSKVHGLAGLRLGYLVGPAEVVATLQRIRAPFSVDRLAQAAGLAALRDEQHRSAVVRHTREHLRLLVDALHAAGFEPVPTQANFVLVPTDDESALVERLRRHGVTVRPGTALGVPGTIRISVPTAAGLDRLARALGRVRAEATAAHSVAR